jgi:hypothetical protein
MRAFFQPGTLSPVARRGEAARTFWGVMNELCFGPAWESNKIPRVICRPLGAFESPSGWAFSFGPADSYGTLFYFDEAEDFALFVNHRRDVIPLCDVRRGNALRRFIDECVVGMGAAARGGIEILDEMDPVEEFRFEYPDFNTAAATTGMVQPAELYAELYMDPPAGL